MKNKRFFLIAFTAVLAVQVFADGWSLSPIINTWALGVQSEYIPEGTMTGFVFNGSGGSLSRGIYLDDFLYNFKSRNGILELGYKHYLIKNQDETGRITQLAPGIQILSKYEAYGENDTLKEQNIFDPYGNFRVAYRFGLNYKNTKDEISFFNKNGFKASGNFAVIQGWNLNNDLALDKSNVFYRGNLDFRYYKKLVDSYNLGFFYNQRCIGDVLFGDSIPASDLGAVQNINSIDINPVSHSTSYLSGKTKIISNSELYLLLPGVLGFDPLLGFKVFMDSAFSDPDLDYNLDIANPNLVIGGALLVYSRVLFGIPLSIQFGGGYEIKSGNFKKQFALSNRF